MSHIYVDFVYQVLNDRPSLKVAIQNDPAYKHMDTTRMCCEPRAFSRVMMIAARLDDNFLEEVESRYLNFCEKSV